LGKCSYYQYAKIIARRVFGAADRKEAKKYNYGFVKETFRDLKSGVKSWSEITRATGGTTVFEKLSRLKNFCALCVLCG
jgi:hypothetical protein